MSDEKTFCIRPNEEVCATKECGGTEVTFTQLLDDSGSPLYISAYGAKNGWSGGGIIAEIFNVDGGHVAVHPFNRRPMYVRRGLEECVEKVIDDYKGPA